MHVTRCSRTRGYSISSLRKMKRDTLYSLRTKGCSKKCNKIRCKTCEYIEETNQIHDRNNCPIALKDQLNCQSRNIIYRIQCSNCKISYIGATSQKLKDRINQHRSDIKRKQEKVIAIHFNEHCPNMTFFKVTPIEKVFRAVPETYTWRGIEERCDQYLLLKREQFWIKKLKTLEPFGLNKREEMPPPIPFCVKFNDKTHAFSKFVTTTYNKIRERGGFRKEQLVIAYKKNPSLKQLLVRSKLN